MLLCCFYVINFIPEICWSCGKLRRSNLSIKGLFVYYFSFILCKYYTSYIPPLIFDPLIFLSVSSIILFFCISLILFHSSSSSLFHCPLFQFKFKSIPFHLPLAVFVLVLSMARNCLDEEYNHRKPYVHGLLGFHDSGKYRSH